MYFVSQIPNIKQYNTKKVISNSTKFLKRQVQRSCHANQHLACPAVVDWVSTRVQVVQVHQLAIVPVVHDMTWIPLLSQQTSKLSYLIFETILFYITVTLFFKTNLTLSLVHHECLFPPGISTWLQMVGSTHEFVGGHVERKRQVGWQCRVETFVWVVFHQFR